MEAMLRGCCLLGRVSEVWIGGLAGLVREDGKVLRVCVGVWACLTVVRIYKNMHSEEGCYFVHLLLAGCLPRRFRCDVFDPGWFSEFYTTIEDSGYHK